MSFTLSLTIDQPDLAWFLEAGSMAVFAVNTSSDQAGHRYLFSVTAGEFLFPMSAQVQPEGAQYKLVAVAIDVPILTPLVPAELEQNQAVDLATLVRQWSEHLSSVFANSDIAFSVIHPIEVETWATLQFHLINLQVEFFRKLTQLTQPSSPQPESVAGLL